jgi:hypothetical protein
MRVEKAMYRKEVDVQKSKGASNKDKSNEDPNAVTTPLSEAHDVQKSYLYVFPFFISDHHDTSTSTD